MVHVEQVISIDLNGVLFRDAVPHGFVGEVGTAELLALVDTGRRHGKLMVWGMAWSPDPRIL